jgi:sugar/nucleoside kinase (ribokinase family)
MSGGLLQMSGVVVDFVHRVKRLPARGEEVESETARLAAGGGFNAMAAAKRLGAEVAYGGALGVGPFADIARTALEREGVRVLRSSRAAIDQGVCVVLVDPQGERSFVSHHGAERAIAAADLAAIPAAEYEWVLLSGYSLYHPRSADVFAAWLEALPRGPRLLFDPGPVVAEIARPRLEAALARADWVSANRREAAALTGCDDPVQAAQTLARGREGALVRAGADGCWLAGAEDTAAHVEGFAVEAIDTTGAGDAHDGAFIAAILQGRAPRVAAVIANAAAAISVTRQGPATAPTLAEVLAFLSARGADLGPIKGMGRAEESLMGVRVKRRV